MDSLLDAVAKISATSICLLGLLQTVPAQVPRIDSIQPAQGPIAGGTVVTITGANFSGASVTVDKTTTTAQVLSATEIRFTTAAHDNGIASIKAATTAGAAYGEFLFVPPRLQDLPPGYITTVAGIGLFTGFYRPANQAQIMPQGSPAFDRMGNLYIPEPSNNRISRVRPDGIIEPFAGTGNGPIPGDSVGDGGPASEALINFPRGVTTDSDGNVYIAEQMSRIRRVDGRSGIITTIAGDGTAGFSGDGGPAVRAHLNNASHITGDGRGTIFFIDFDDVSSVARIRKITPDGIINTVAGTGPPGFSGDGGPATQAQFNLVAADLGSLALDSQGNLFLADKGNNRIRKIDGRTGTVTTVFGSSNAPRTLAAVATDTAGNIYIAEPNSWISKLSPNGEILATYGNGRYPGFSEDGTAISEVFITRNDGLVIDPVGNIVYADQTIGRVRRFNLATGRVETLAGIGPRIIGDNGPAIATGLQNHHGGDVAFLPTGELLIGDTGHELVRKIDRSGNISTFAKGGLAALLDGNPAEVFIGTVALRPDGAGNIFLADGWNIYRIDAVRTVHLVAGRTREAGYSGDGGPATEALLCQPWDVARDVAGNLFIADSNNNRIRRVDARTGIITTVVGNGPVNGYERYFQGRFSGDKGPALQAYLNTPMGVAIDSRGNLFIADLGNNRIRKVDANGIITTFAQTTASKLIFDGTDSMYLAMSFGVFRYDPNGFPTRLAGQSGRGFSGDGGPALHAKITAFGLASGIAIDAEGNIFFADNQNCRVRAIRYGALLTPPTLSTQRVNRTVNAGQDATFTVTATGLPIPSYRWQRQPAGSSAWSNLNDGGSYSGVTSATLTITATTGAMDGDQFRCVVSNGIGSDATSSVATLSVPFGRLANLSARGKVGVGGQPIIVGVAVTGGTKQLLVRAVGPGLATSFGLSGVLTDPRLEIHQMADSQDRIVASNDNWSNAGIATLSTAFASAGAFPLETTSRDAASLVNASGTRTVHASGVPSTSSGVVLVEVYDLGTANTPRLSNLSVRNQVGTGDDVLVAGLVINGTAPKRLLVRGVGPGLAQFGVSGFLPDPQVEVIPMGRQASNVGRNDNWGGTAILKAAFTQAGAFSLVDDSKDAATVVILPPGGYTVVVSGVGDTTGDALVEIFDLDP